MVDALDSGLPAAAKPPWHSRACDDVLSALSATREGLCTEEARKRLVQYGANVLDRKGGASVMALIWGQINNPLIWVLIGSAVIAMLVDPADGLKNGLVILAVVAAPEGLKRRRRLQRCSAQASCPASSASLLEPLAPAQREIRRRDLDFPLHAD